MNMTREEAEFKLRAGWKAYAERFAEAHIKTYRFVTIDPEGYKRQLIADCMRQAERCIQDELGILFGDRTLPPLSFLDGRRPEERLLKD